MKAFCCSTDSSLINPWPLGWGRVKFKSYTGGYMSEILILFKKAEPHETK